MTDNTRTVFTTAIFLAIAACGLIPAHGAQLMSDSGKMVVGKSALPAPDEDAVELEAGFDFWLPWIDGDIIAPVEIGLDHLIKHLDMYFPVNLDVRKGRWGVDANFLYMKVSGHDNFLPGEILSSARINIKMVLTEAVVYNRLAEWDNGESFFDLGAGARYTWIDIDLGLTPDDPAIQALSDQVAEGLVDRSVLQARLSSAIDQDLLGKIPGRTTAKEGWVNPIVMLRLRQKLGDKLFFQFYGDVGGFGVSSDMTFTAEAGLGYEVTDNLTAGLSFRYYYDDYEKGDFVFDVDIFGPVVWVTYNF